MREPEDEIVELKELFEELSKLESEEDISDSDFSAAFSKARDALQLNDQEIIGMLRISRPTIWRWAKGETAPAPLFRPLVFTKLREETERRMAAFKAPEFS